MNESHVTKPDDGIILEELKAKMRKHKEREKDFYRNESLVLMEKWLIFKRQSKILMAVRNFKKVLMRKKMILKFYADIRWQRKNLFLT